MTTTLQGLMHERVREENKDHISNITPARINPFEALYYLDDPHTELEEDIERFKLDIDESEENVLKVNKYLARQREHEDLQYRTNLLETKIHIINNYRDFSKSQELWLKKSMDGYEVKYISTIEESRNHFLYVSNKNPFKKEIKSIYNLGEEEDIEKNFIQLKSKSRDWQKAQKNFLQNVSSMYNTKKE